MKVIVNPERRDWNAITRRALPDDGVIGERVEKIISRVRKDGDKALLSLAQEIDGVALTRVDVGRDQIEAAANQISDDLKKAIAISVANVRKFHAAQLGSGVDIETMPGVRCVQKNVPVQRVGLYVPGGSAPLFSTVIMLAVPAKVAGCPEIVLCTPPDKSGRVAPEILYAASVCGVDKVFMSGGAQAVAAMAYGTESIPKVDKIFGPGNRYVTKAKQLVSLSEVAIDMPAGPSEVMVMADSTAVPEFVAADMLSQAEHGRDSQSVLVTDSRSFAERTIREIESQLAVLSRSGFASDSLEHGFIVVMDERQDMIDFANVYAAEHLIISMENAWDVAGQITAAGSIFLGNYSPESAGDYASGTNHTLPTSGWARAFSGVNVDSFLKKITIQELTLDGLRGIGQTVMDMTSAEGLDGHRNAVKIRLEKAVR